MEQLLSTKFYIPPTRPKLVSRPRLVERINQGLHRKLTLISAPAGFGKTTLVSEWIEHARSDNQNEFSIAWLSLDETDNDLVRFLSYFIVALRRADRVDDNFGRGIQGMLQAPQPPPTETILISLINELSNSSGKIVLVLDDYHLISDLAADDAITFLLEHIPPQLHLIIATRADPQLPIARLRAKNQLNEVRAMELRFASPEITSFLNQLMKLDLSEDAIAALETRTEGWIAGLQLAAISMQGQQDTTSFISSFTGSNRLVLDYLIEEVIEKQSENIQNFLFKTAILDRMTGSLCDALTNQDDGQATLEELEHANLFIIPLDEERRWYRYHHLFAELLRERLNKTQPQKTLSLHSLASKWYEQQGLIDESIEHALQSKNFKKATQIINEHIEERWRQGKLGRILRWLDKLPDEFINNSPNLCIYLAWNMFINGDQEKAEDILQFIENKLDLQSEPLSDKPLEKSETSDRLFEKNIRGRVAAIRAVMATYRSDAGGSKRFARLAQELLPGDDLNWRSAAAMALADAYVFMGEYDRAHQARFDSIKICKTAGNTYIYLIDRTKFILVLKARGELLQAKEHCQQLMEFAVDNGFSNPGTIGWIQAILGDILAETNDLDAAYEIVREGVNLTELGMDVTLLSWSNMCLTRILFSLGDLNGAEYIIKKTAMMSQEATIPPLVNYQMMNWQVRIWLSQGRLDEALKWMREQAANSDSKTTYVGKMNNIPIARILIAQGLHEETNQLLFPQIQATAAGGHVSREIELLILQALNYEANAENSKAISSLKKALALAEPGGFIRIFVDEGPPMAKLLYEALERGISPNYVNRLMNAFSDLEPAQATPTQTQDINANLIEPLTDRECEVLHLIAEGLTNQEIASRLFLSLNTVKVHIRNIFGKLDVNNRTQAVASAKGLGIL